MLPGMKQRIEVPSEPLIGQTIVRPDLFGSVITLVPLTAVLAAYGVVRNVDPLVVETDAVMAVFGFPVWIGDRKAIRERTAQSFPAREMIEPAIELGMVGVVAERRSAEQQQDQSQSRFHRRVSLHLYVFPQTPRVIFCSRVTA